MRKIRFFGALLRSQEKWLNKMARSGYRMVKTGIMTYDFEPCTPGEYQYAVEYVGAKDWEELQKYRAFLEEMGYTVFYKNINANYSVGKVRFRPYKSKPWIPVTSATNYNKELLIVERKAAEDDFKLHTSSEDIKNYYLQIIATFAFFFALLGGLGIFFKSFIYGGISIVFLIPVIIYTAEILKVKKLEKTEDI